MSAVICRCLQLTADVSAVVCRYLQLKLSKSAEICMCVCRYLQIHTVIPAVILISTHHTADICRITQISAVW
jgi:hypothetical protein